MSTVWGQALRLAESKPRRIEAREPRHDLLPFIPRISPNFSQPAHLAPLVDVMRRAFLAARGLGPPVFACVSEPPQHGKTETLLHGLAHQLEQCPEHNLAYVSYNDDIARDKSRKAKDYAQLAGVELRQDSFSAQTWKTTAGGGMIARGILGGAITGQEGLRVIVVDDPYKNRAEAESRLMRNRKDEEFRSSIVSRLHPTTSIIVNHTRWHVDDQIGRLLKREPDKWEHINLPAINERGEALWPEGQPLDHLLSLKETLGEYTWWSLYMGQPRARGTELFSAEQVHYYDTPPTSYRVAIGVDLAYTSKTSSDWSIAVVMAEATGVYYVLDVVRKQVSAPEFLGELKALRLRYPGAPMRAYLSGTEKGAADFFNASGLGLTVEQPSGDKFVRAQPFSAAWNAGKVRLPTGRSWVEPYTACLLDFTGQDDPQDDDVDASAPAFDTLAATTGRPVTQPRPRDPSMSSFRRRKGAW